jgi:hypothetical protein
MFPYSVSFGQRDEIAFEPYCCRIVSVRPDVPGRFGSGDALSEIDNVKSAKNDRI